MVRSTPAAATSERGTIAGEMVVTILMALTTRSGVGEAREGLGRSKAAVCGGELPVSLGWGLTHKAFPRADVCLSLGKGGFVCNYEDRNIYIYK